MINQEPSPFPLKKDSKEIYMEDYLSTMVNEAFTSVNPVNKSSLPNSHKNSENFNEENYSPNSINNEKENGHKKSFSKNNHLPQYINGNSKEIEGAVFEHDEKNNEEQKINFGNENQNEEKNISEDGNIKDEENFLNGNLNGENENLDKNDTMEENLPNEDVFNPKNTNKDEHQNYLKQGKNSDFKNDKIITENYPKNTSSKNLVDFEIKEKEIPNTENIVNEEKIPNSKNIANEEKIPNTENIVNEEKIPNSKNIANEEKIPNTENIVNEEENLNTENIVNEEKIQNTENIVNEEKIQNTENIVNEEKIQNTENIVNEEENLNTENIVNEEENLNTENNTKQDKEETRIINDEKTPPLYSEEDIRKTVEYLKKTADEYFRIKNYNLAIQHYEKSLNYLHFEKRPGQVNILIDKELVTNVVNNKTQCYLNIGDNNKAFSNALFVLKLDPLNIKAYFRAGKACEELQDYESGYKILQKGLQYLENTHPLKNSYIKLFNSIKKQNKMVNEEFKKKMKNFTTQEKDKIRVSQNDEKILVETENQEKKEKMTYFLWNKKVFVYSIFNSLLLSGVCPYLYNNNWHEKLIVPFSYFVESMGRFFNFNHLLSIGAIFGLSYTFGFLFQYFFGKRNKKI